MERKMDDLYNATKIAFASTFSFYLKAQNFHWNVEGSDFLEYHDLFGKIYEILDMYRDTLLKFN
jgi:DNA-binding ferritin-like protein